VLRIGTAVIIVGGVLLLNPYPLWWWVAGGASLVSVLAPRSMGSWIGIACMAVGMVLTEPSAARTALAILLIHAAHVLAAWAWAVPWRSASGRRAAARRAPSASDPGDRAVGRGAHAARRATAARTGIRVAGAARGRCPHRSERRRPAGVMGTGARVEEAVRLAAGRR
jgi:threonine/homoserine/homoserine lactone efflux protein